MPVPDKPLIITGEDGKPFKFGELYLEEAALFERDTPFDRRAVIKFLQAHSNWSRAEIARIQEQDLLGVWNQIVAKVNEATTPLPQ